MKRICKVCGQEFKTYPSRHKSAFCSRQCLGKWQSQTRKKATRGIARQCEICGKEFRAVPANVRAGKAKYCSNECRYIGRSKGYGHERTIVCLTCGKSFRYTYKRQRKYCSNECRYVGARGVLKFGGPKWLIDGQGYIVRHIELPDGTQITERQHRVIMAEHLGRPLREDEVVHHINGDRADNRIENLAIMAPGEHSRLHATTPEGQKYRAENCRKLQARKRKEREARKS